MSKSYRRCAAALLSAFVSAACVADPPPAPQSPQTSQVVAPPPAVVKRVIVGVDSIGTGFNPHMLSHQSPVNAAMSTLVLPSAFRPVSDASRSTGLRWDMDSTLLISAEVTHTDPFIVTYTIRPEAAWTDNAPIGADDFWYLWQQMLSQPGVVDPAGYHLITDVQSMNAGKTAVVTFVEQYPAWRELFSGLLPSHIVKDVPGGFAGGLVRAMSVTGGQFRVDEVDVQREEILLVRNDRFWGSPAVPDQIIFRRAGTPAALADSIRNGHTQVAQVHGDAVVQAQLAAIPQVRTARIATPRVLQLLLRAHRGPLSEVAVRRAVLGLLDDDVLAAVGAGSMTTVTRARAQVRAPSDPGYIATAPEALSRERAVELLIQAGFHVEVGDSPSTAGPVAGSTAGPTATATAVPMAGVAHRIVRGGKQLSLVIGAAADDPIAVAVAHTAADQLRNEGIAARVASLDPVMLYTDALAHDRIDALVGWRAGGGDVATALESRYGCPALRGQALPVSSRVVSPSEVAAAEEVPVPQSGPGSKSGSESSSGSGRSTTASVPSNLTGICDPTLQPTIDAALTGSEDIDDVISEVEPRLWSMATVLPIIQDTTVVAAGPQVRNVSLSGAVPVGIVGDAGRWLTGQ